MLAHKIPGISGFISRTGYAALLALSIAATIGLHSQLAADAGQTSGLKNDPQAALRTLLYSQAEAWNRGDLEGFMQGYWKSDRTAFVGSSGVLRGWQALLERYRRSYPDQAAMGRLEFSELEITPLASDAALILGRWKLQREHDQPGGVFTLIAKRFPEGWRIIHDHTTAVVPSEAPRQ